MLIQTKFLRLRRPVALGERIDGWRVCWQGGWDKLHFFFVVMVERAAPEHTSRRQPPASPAGSGR